MKRLSIVGLMLASAFALTNCSQEIVPPIQENDVIVDESIKEDTTPEEVVSIPFEVYANPSAETKTSHDSANNGTKWEAKDEINVYHSVHGENSYTNNHKFTIADVDKGLFGGGLAEPLASGTYDWCFLYPYDDSRGNTTTTTVQIGATKGTDGAYVQRLTNGAGSKEHIAGTLFPMYGHASGISADQNPKVQMRHMSAIVALKVVNQGDSKKENLEQEKNDTDKRDIVINDITFAVPAYSTSAISQTAIPIVGSFNVDPTNDINSASFTPVTGASSNSVTLEFASTTIKPGESATFYLAVRPFDVSNSELGGSEKRTGLTLSITINGSTRSVEIPADTKFEAGKVTTLRVPVKLSYPKVSDVMTNTNFLKFNNKKDVTLSVNGEQASGYSLEKEKTSWGRPTGTYEQATLTISGTAKDLMNALPAGFYASTYNGKRAAMTVTNINLHIPEYDDSGNVIKYTQIASYAPFINKIKGIVVPIIDSILGDGEEWWEGKWLLIIKVSIKDIFTGIFKSGIPREGGLLNFTKFIDPQTITFNSILENGSTSSSDNLLILDEEPIYKGITQAQVENLLLTKFTSNGVSASYNGIKDIVNKNYTTDANNSAKAIWGKLKEVIGTMEIELYEGVKISVWDVFTSIFPDETTMKTMLGDLKVDVTIGSYPYAADKSEYGSKAGGPKVPDAPYYPIVFWGLDAYGPDKSSL